MYNPNTIANYFIYKSIDEGLRITPMKVLKLVYIAHGWHLGLIKEPLLTEQAEAWKFGPVIESVYQTFKNYGKQDIDSMNLSYKIVRSEFENLIKNDNDRAFLDKVWNVYKKFSGSQLSSLTHLPDTPWDITWNKNKGSLKHGAIIPNALIKEHYERKAISTNQNATA